MNVHVLAHTHWDREWYLPVGRFRQRLVALVDELLDDPPPAGESFLLDGQAIIIEDYLAVRPERRARLEALLRDGRLEAGPWYVLADELIPSGEALVRNLLAGRRALRSLGAESPPVLYCPDSFGHPAALPELAHGFGLPLIVLWRGYGSERWPASDTVEWRAPSGASAILFHLPRSGYEFGSSLPVARDEAARRWRQMRDELAPRSRTGELLVQNGADHHARQARYREALAALAEAAAPDDIANGSSLRRFATAVVGAARTVTLPVVTGELRDSYGYTWTLQGTFASRAQQKRRNALAERLLLREAEPWSALARLARGTSRAPLVAAAWRALLETHPHDTLCGCSIDDVAAAMDVRNADARAQGKGIVGDSLHALLGHDESRARVERERWTPVVVLRNGASRSRGGVAEIEIREFLADVPVGPGSGAPVAVPDDALPPARADGLALQILEQSRAMDRVESPRHYPDNDLVRITRAVTWCEPIAGYGLTSRTIGRASDRPVHPPKEARVRARGRSLENDRLRITVNGDGEVTFEDLALARRIESLVRIEDRDDHGDLYTPSIRDTKLQPRFRGARVVHRGPLRGVLRLQWTLHAPSTRAQPSGRLELDLVLDAGAPFLRIDLRGENFHDDHRLRVGLRTGLETPRVYADAAFGAVLREPIVVTDSETRAERPPRTAPLHRYVSMFGAKSADAGATLVSDGLAEYEVTPEGEIYVTLLRAVGELSRNDLPERPGHAGWPTPTPAAQSHGPFEARIALFLHGARDASTVSQIERVADDVLLPLTGETLRSALAVPPSTKGVELEGEGLAFSSLKEQEDGAGVVARCVNLLDHEVHGAWRFGSPIRSATLARLDETVLEALEAQNGVVPFVAPPRAVVTIIVDEVRPAP